MKKLIRALRTACAVIVLITEWYYRIKKIGSGKVISKSGFARKVLIIPSDISTLIGAKGDEAMISVIIEWARLINPRIEISIVVASFDASKSAELLGCKPFMLLPKGPSFKQLTDVVAKYDIIVVVGADVMDGYYSPVDALRSWLLADLAARQGVRSIILGSSFNANPSRYLKFPLNTLDPRVEINLRDAMSLERFQRFSCARARLVADAAFMLSPTADTNVVAMVRDWVEAQRFAHQAILGFNIHPLLIKGITNEQISVLVQIAERALAQLMDTHPVSVLLIPHDYRGRGGDTTCLTPLFEALHLRFQGRVFLPVEQMSASELKAVAGLTDAVVTGRMHLAIAALGQGKPVGGLTYQDKFQGLFQHFKLPGWLLLDPIQLQGSNNLYDMMERLLNEHQMLANDVQRELPGVLELSRRNFTNFHKTGG